MMMWKSRTRDGWDINGKKGTKGGWWLMDVVQVFVYDTPFLHSFGDFTGRVLDDVLDSAED